MVEEFGQVADPCIKAQVYPYLTCHILNVVFHIRADENVPGAPNGVTSNDNAFFILARQAKIIAINWD